MPTGKGNKDKKLKAVAGEDDDGNLVEIRTLQLQAAVEQIPQEKIVAFLKPRIPLLVKVAIWFELTALPAIANLSTKVYEFYARNKHLTEGDSMKDLIPAIFGFILCFFGGVFPLLIASVEGFELGGFANLRQSLKDLYSQASAAWEASKKDDEVDADGDGIADVKQISARKLYVRKVLLCAKVVDPAKVQENCLHISTGVLSVLAVLKMEFARAIALGAQVSTLLKRQVDEKVIPAIVPLVPDELQKWVEPVTGFIVKTVVCSLAMAVARIVSAVHSALRGGRLAGEGIVRYLYRIGQIDFKPEDSYVDETIGYAMAAVGFLFQIYMGFHLFFPVNLFLFPFTMAEYSLATGVQYL